MKCKCNVCDQKLEFDDSCVGQTVNCPSCGNDTILYQIPVSKNNCVKTKPRLKSLLLLSFLIPISFGIWYYNIHQTISDSDVSENETIVTNPIPVLPDKPFFITTEEKTARDNILKTLIDLNSATTVGVNYMTYGELVRKSLSTCEFELIKLDVERNKKFLVSVSKAFKCYEIVYDNWKDYFKYDHLRKSDSFSTSPELIISYGNRLGIQTNVLFSGSTWQSSGLLKIDKDRFISVFWQAAGRHVEDLKEMSK